MKEVQGQGRSSILTQVRISCHQESACSAKTTCFSSCTQPHLAMYFSDILIGITTGLFQPIYSVGMDHSSVMEHMVACIQEVQIQFLASSIKLGKAPPSEALESHCQSV